MKVRHLSCKDQNSTFIISTYKDELNCSELRKLQEIWDCTGNKIVASYFKSGNGFTVTESEILKIDNGLELGDYDLIRLEFLP